MPRMPKSATSTPSKHTRRASSHPNPSSPRKTLPIPATSTRSGDDLLRREEEAMPALAEVAARVVVDQHADEHAALHVGLDDVDDRGLAGQREVEHVAARARAQLHPRSNR